MKDNPTQVAAQEPESAPASSVTALAESYAQMNNEQLAALYQRRDTLGPEARQALDLELSKREAAAEQSGRAKVVSGVDGWLALLIFMLVFSGFGVYAGILLWRKRPGAVRVAKANFLALAMLSLLLLLVAASSAVMDPGRLLGLSLVGGWYGVLAMIWHAYLRKSKRVAATYPLG